MGLGNRLVYIQRLMATVAMGLGQFHRFLSCDLGTGPHPCDLGTGLHSAVSTPGPVALHAFPELERKPGRGWGLGSPTSRAISAGGHGREHNWERSRGLRSKGTCPAMLRQGRGSQQTQSGARRQRRWPGAGLAEASGHGEPGAEGLLGEDGVWGGLTMATTGGDSRWYPSSFWPVRW